MTLNSTLQGGVFVCGGFNNTGYPIQPGMTAMEKVLLGEQSWIPDLVGCDGKYVISSPLSFPCRRESSAA